MNDKLPTIKLVGYVPEIRSAIQTGGDESEVKIRFPLSELAQVLKLHMYRGQTFVMTISPDEEKQQSEPEAEEPIDISEVAKSHPDLAYELHCKGYFRNPRLWKAAHDTGAYMLQEHAKWISTQGGCLVPYQQVIIEISRPFCKEIPFPASFRKKPCSGSYVGHHARSAANAGTALKPEDWYLVPLCDAHHKMVHSKEVTADLNEKLLEFAVGMVANAIKNRLKKFLDRDTLSGLTQEEMVLWHFRIEYVLPHGNMY